MPSDDRTALIHIACAGHSTRSASSNEIQRKAKGGLTDGDAAGRDLRSGVRTEVVEHEKPSACVGHIRRRRLEALGVPSSHGRTWSRWLEAPIRFVVHVLVMVAHTAEWRPNSAFPVRTGDAQPGAIGDTVDARFSPRRLEVRTQA